MRLANLHNAWPVSLTITIYAQPLQTCQPNLAVVVVLKRQSYPPTDQTNRLHPETVSPLLVRFCLNRPDDRTLPQCEMKRASMFVFGAPQAQRTWGDHHRKPLGEQNDEHEICQGSARSKIPNIINKGNPQGCVTQEFAKLKTRRIYPIPRCSSSIDSLPWVFPNKAVPQPCPSLAENVP